MTTSTNKLGKSIDAEKHLLSDLRVATDKFFMGNENFFPQITNDVTFITLIFIRKTHMGSYAGLLKNKRKSQKTGIQQFRLFKETLSLSLLSACKTSYNNLSNRNERGEKANMQKLCEQMKVENKEYAQQVVKSQEINDKLKVEITNLTTEKKKLEKFKDDCIKLKDQTEA